MSQPLPPTAPPTTATAAGRALLRHGGRMLALTLPMLGIALAIPKAGAQTFPPPPAGAGATPSRTPTSTPRTPVVAPPRSPHAEKAHSTLRRIERHEPGAPLSSEKPQTRPAHPATSHTAPARTGPAHPSTPPAVSPAPTPEATTTAPPPGLDPNKGSVTGQDLPRWASLRSDDVNLRIGPGTNFQIDWVYHRRDLPVKIEREYEVWRQVEDMDGIKGWVHQATLAGRRTFVIKDAERTLRAAGDDGAGVVARLKPGVVGRIRSCAPNVDWCEVQTGDYHGFLKREQFWGSFPGEPVNP